MPDPSAAPVDKRDVRIRRMFGQIAPWYDFLNHLLTLNVDRAWRRRTARLVPPGPAERGPILDLCTGTGDLALAYDRAAGGRVPIVGADFCPEMLARAGAKAARAGAAGRVSFVEADALALPFPDGAFQIVSNAFGLRNVADLRRGLRETVRVTRPGGTVAVLETSRPRHRFFGRAYRAYMLYLLPLVGQLLSRSREGAYRYLPESTMQFPDAEALAEIMRASGLTDVAHYPFTFGVVTLYVGTKPAPTAGERAR